MYDFKSRPQEFLDNVDNLQHDHAGWMACLTMLEMGQIDIQQFDTAAALWIKSNAEVLKMISDKLANAERMKRLGYQIKSVLHVVTHPQFPFPQALAAFREKKAALLSVNIADDGGHWENSVKLILREL